MPLTFLTFTLTALANIVIAAFVYANNPKHGSNRLFAVLGVAVSLWLMTMMLTWMPTLFPWILHLVRLNLVATTWMNVSFLLFGRVVPDAARGFSRKALAALFSAAGVVSVVSVSPLTFSDIRVIGDAPEPIPGPGLPIFGLFQLGLIFATVAIFFRKVKASSGKRLLQLRLIMLGFLLMSGMLFGTVFVPVLLLRDAAFVPVSPLFMFLFTGPAAYAIFKHKLFDIKVVAAEMFSAVLMFISAIQLLQSSSTLDFVLRLVMFASVSVVGVMFIHSVRDEVRRREEIQQLATKLEVSNKRLRALDELKTTMVGIASHQIRGPLGGIRGYLSMFNAGDFGPLTSKQQEAIAINLNVLSRLINAVETFLDITKLESGKIMLSREKVDLDDVVRLVIDEFRVPMEKRGLEFEYHPEPGAAMPVRIDPEKTKHIVFNLIDNAMKYTEKGSVAVRLRIEDADAVCEVSDTGMGIPDEDISRLFGKYERGELVVDRGGSGLGLYVVKMLTELQGGRVWVTSPGVGRGAAFSVSFPLAK